MSGFLVAGQTVPPPRALQSMQSIAGGVDRAGHAADPHNLAALARRRRKAVFLDKDGTLIADVPYNVDPGLVQLSDGAGEALRLLREHGFRLYVVSNQSGVAHGLFEESALQPVWHRVQRLLAAHAVALDGFYYCPHHPDGVVDRYARTCECRKPRPGMLRRAAGELDIDLGASWMIGDILHDIEAGRRAGCRTVLIDNGNETEWQLSPLRVPQVWATDLRGAAWSIIEDEQTRHQHRTQHQDRTQNHGKRKGQKKGTLQRQRGAQTGRSVAQWVDPFDTVMAVPTR